MEVLSLSIPHLLNINAQSALSLAKFCIDRLLDFPTVPQVLQCALALLRFQPPAVPSTTASELALCVLGSVNVQALNWKGRNCVFGIAATVLADEAIKREIVSVSAEQFLEGFLHSMDGEKDPRNLLMCFRTLKNQLLSADFEAAVSRLADEIFEILTCYFPITFTPPKDDPFGISSQDLIMELRACLSRNRHLSSNVIPFLLDKLLSAPNPATKIDSLLTLKDTLEAANLDAVAPFLREMTEACHNEILQAADEDVVEACLKLMESISVLAFDASVASIYWPDTGEHTLGFCVSELSHAIDSKKSVASFRILLAMCGTPWAFMKCFQELETKIISPGLAPYQSPPEKVAQLLKLRFQLINSFFEKFMVSSIVSGVASLVLPQDLLERVATISSESVAEIDLNHHGDQTLLSAHLHCLLVSLRILIGGGVSLVDNASLSLTKVMLTISKLLEHREDVAEVVLECVVLLVNHAPENSECQDVLMSLFELSLFTTSISRGFEKLIQQSRKARLLEFLLDLMFAELQKGIHSRDAVRVKGVLAGLAGVVRSKIERKQLESLENVVEKLYEVEPELLSFCAADVAHLLFDIVDSIVAVTAGSSVFIEKLAVSAFEANQERGETFHRSSIIQVVVSYKHLSGQSSASFKSFFERTLKISLETRSLDCSAVIAGLINKNSADASVFEFLDTFVGDLRSTMLDDESKLVDELEFKIHQLSLFAKALLMASKWAQADKLSEFIISEMGQQPHKARLFAAYFPQVLDEAGEKLLSRARGCKINPLFKQKFVRSMYARLKEAAAAAQEGSKFPSSNPYMLAILHLLGEAPESLLTDLGSDTIVSILQSFSGLCQDDADRQSALRLICKFVSVVLLLLKVDV
eukprot:TRINITY_DN1285_c0_g1_i3.p1 TRINITY_DN1285_c0_g1~~TRINITY_DN1285_c0_g1_i3.p1  ORF type:complete len:956 (+),score=250.79 TRINITY_DN1285_c0_g1_i3:257-2869(+)